MSCPDCFRGHDHPGPVNGFETELHAHNVYVTEPPERERVEVKGLIVILTDAFGWNTVNIRRLADSYARRTGCRVYIPDFMYGTAAPPSMKSVMDRLVSERGIWGWLAKPFLLARFLYSFVPFILRNKPPKRLPAIKQFLAGLRATQPAHLRIGVAGFCWGGYGATHLAHGGGLVDAAYTAHPSELKVPEDIEGITVPYSMVIGDADFALDIERVREVEEVLRRKKDVESEVVVLPGAAHGFAVRGRPDDEREKEQADQAEDQAVRWFGKHLVAS